MAALYSQNRTLVLKRIVRTGTGGYQNTNAYLTWVDTRQGVDVKDWAWKIANLQSASSEYTRDIIRVLSYGQFGASVTYFSDKSPQARIWTDTVSDNTWAAKPGLYPGIPQSVENTALGNFLVDANQKVSPFKGGVFLGELRETLHMIRHPAESLRRGVSAYLGSARRTLSRVQRRKAAIKAISDSWLEYSFGWKPLISDIESAVQAYKAFSDRQETVFCIGKASDDFGGTTSSSELAYPQYTWCVATTIATLHADVKYKGVFRVKPNGIQLGTADRILELSGFRLEEFIPTVWELIPYSWLVDYFTNIGDILNGMHALSLDWVWLSKATKATSRVKKQVALNVQKTSASTGGLYIASQVQKSIPMILEREYYHRTVPTLSLPELQVSMTYNWNRWTNIAALFAQRLSR